MTALTLDGVTVRPFDTVYYQPTTGPEVEATVRNITDEGVDVVVEGRSIGLSREALAEAESEGRLRVAPAAGRVGEGQPESYEAPQDGGAY